MVGKRHNFVKKKANAITRHEKNKLSHATSVDNRLKQTEEIIFVVSNIVSIVSYQSNKPD